jgi:hypothetical protein
MKILVTGEASRQEKRRRKCIREQRNPPQVLHSTEFVRSTQLLEPHPSTNHEVHSRLPSQCRYARRPGLHPSCRPGRRHVLRHQALKLWISHSSSRMDKKPEDQVSLLSDARRRTVMRPDGELKLSSNFSSVLTSKLLGMPSYQPRTYLHFITDSIE